MLEFRKSLPAYKEKERLLAAIARNQVYILYNSQHMFMNHRICVYCIHVWQFICLFQFF